MKKIFFSLLVLAFSVAKGQQNTQKCGHDYVNQTMDSLFGDHNALRQSFFAAYEESKQQGGTPEAVVYTIPVVVHIIYDDANSNISREQVLDAIRLLNIDYRRQNADTANTRAIFKPVAADIEVEFALAKLDPNGQCTEGITRTFSTLTNGANHNVKSLVNWNNKRYLNIWVVKSITLAGAQNVLGFAAFPVAGGNPANTDGIVIRHDQMGAIGTAKLPTLGTPQFGRTLTHESGHYLGLDHTFLGGCFGQGDRCADTPPVLEANFGCNLSANTCSNDVPDLVDMIENYMDYSDGDCLNLFTNNQKSIMRFSLTSTQYRNQLVTSATATATGIALAQVLPCAPTADFAADDRLICEGESIAFEDRTYMGNATGYQWTFAGGNPASSTQKNPVVTYAQKGIYPVELTTTNATGTSTKLNKGYISVRSQTSTPYVNTFGDDFELYPIPNENWHVVPGLDTATFRYFTKTAFAGQSCVTQQNFYALPNETDEMISHAIYVGNSKTVDLQFNYAFAERTNGNTDKLRIHISDDCGETWTQVANRQGPLLRTVNPKIDTAWWPTQNSHWAQAMQPLTNYAQNSTPILIKFEFINGGGNNFYLDDVQIATTIGTQELFGQGGLRIYPNPITNGGANNFVTVELDENIPVTFTLMDATGRIIAEQSSAEGQSTFTTQQLPRGLYVVVAVQNSKTFTQKLIID